MEANEKQSVFKAALGYGAILGLVMIANNLLIYMMEIKQTAFYAQWSPTLILISGIIFSTLHFRKEQGALGLKYGKAFLCSFFTASASGLIFALYYLLFLKYFDPGLLEQSMVVLENYLAENHPEMSQAAIDNIVEQRRKWMTPEATGMWIFIGTLFWASIFSAIAAIFLRKKETTNNTPDGF